MEMVSSPTQVLWMWSRSSVLRAGIWQGKRHLFFTGVFGAGQGLNNNNRYSKQLSYINSICTITPGGRSYYPEPVLCTRKLKPSAAE